MTQQVSLVEISSLNLGSNTAEMLYYSNTSYITTPTDTPANTAYLPRVDSALEISRDIFKGLQGGRIASAGIGSIVLSNPDGALDSIYSTNLLIGRSITIKAGDIDGGHVNLTTILVGVIRDVDYSQSNVTLQVQDRNAVFDTEISTTLYTPVTGSGEVTFNTSLHDSPLPICYGDVRNVTPIHVGAVLSGDLYTSTFDAYYIGDSMSLSEDKLTATNDDVGTWGTAYAAAGVGSGKSYLEFDVTHTTEGYVGITTSVGRPRTTFLGNTTGSYGYRASDGYLVNNGTPAAFHASFLGAATIGIAIDADAGKVWFARNNVWSGNPSTGVGAAISGLTGVITPGVSSNDPTDSVLAVFNTGDHTYSPPSGFNAGTSNPIAVNELIYQVHDGAIEDIVAVYAGGSLVDPGNYTKLLSEGKFQLDIGSASGYTITADVKGSTAPATYNKVGDIIKDLITNRISPSISYNSSSFDDLEDAYFSTVSIVDTARCGFYLPKGGSVKQVLTLFNRSFGMYTGFDRSGVFDIGIFKGPDSGASALDLAEENVSEVVRLPVKVPTYEHSVEYAHNYTVLGDSSLASVVIEQYPDHHAFLGEANRVATADEYELGIRLADDVVEAIPVGSEGLYQSLKDRYPTSVPSDASSSVIYSGVDAYLEAKRRWRLYNSGGTLRQASYIRVTLATKSEIEINDTVKLTYPRLGLDSGSYYTVVAVSEDVRLDEMELDLWAGSEDSFTDGDDVNVATITADYVQYEGIL